MNKMKLSQLENPSAEYRPMPLWSWNERITREGIQQQLRAFAEQGFGGVFIHPRPGLISCYLSEEWFELWQHAVEVAEALGMECHIYDENSFPSGFAGGHVYDQYPHLGITELLRVTPENREELIRNREILKVFIIECANNRETCREVEGLEAVRPQSYPNRAFVLCRGRKSLWTASFPYTDLAQVETCRRFIEITHEQYKRHLHFQFGKCIKYVFTDEPTLSLEEGLNVSSDFLSAFRDEHGYDFLSRLPSYSSDSDEGKALRYDYNKTINRLFVINYNKQLYDWCEDNGLQYTGHFDEHRWPYVSSIPSAMAAQRWMHVPGIDLLGFQFAASNYEQNDYYLMNIKEVVSVANQLNRPRILCEAFGGGGFEMGPSDFKGLADYLLVHGVDFINPHMSDWSILGSRKYDFPQVFTPHSSWFDFLKPLNDHIARLSVLLNHTRPRNRVLLLQPTLTAWMHYRPKSFAEGDSQGVWEDKLELIKRSQVELIQYLNDRCINFDLGDECIMAELAEADGALLRIGAAEYDTVILPRYLENIAESTLQLLGSYLAGGGQVLVMTAALSFSDSPPSVQTPTFVEGCPDSRVSQLAGLYPDQWKLSTISARKFEHSIVDLISRDVRIVDMESLPRGVSCSSRFDSEGKRYLLFSNYSNGRHSFRVSFPQGRVEQLNPENGAWERLSVVADSKDRSRMIHWVTLEAKGAHVLCIDHGEAPDFEPVGPEIVTQSGLREGVPLGQVVGRRLGKNVLNLNYGSLIFGGKRLGEMHVAVADKTVWELTGEPQNLWEWSIQFGENFIHREYPESTAHAMDYGFRVAEEALASIRDNCEVAVERPHLYEMSINGVRFGKEGDDGEHFLGEPDFRTFPIGCHLHSGLNTIRLSMERHSVFSEIAPVYVLGDFCLEPVEAGFEIHPMNAFGLGSWDDLGMPFYPWDVEYSFEVNLEKDADGLDVEIDPRAWDGSVMRLQLDDGNCLPRLWPPCRWELPGRIDRGRHVFKVIVTGNMRNLFGPYHEAILPVVSNWRQAPDRTPLGSEYRFEPSGLYQVANVWIL